ncbi:MAG: hypothetical protein CMJ48_00990 [Planctomycetaceae bacterium]|nr:hypothetical protein [Planctomycetaceae bacterium]
MRYDPDVQRAVSSYQLGLPKVPVSGRTGDLLGRGTGSSLEFQEYREYMPGDDIRHLDWGAYARSDTLMVRLYREEISPRTEILIDASASMTTGTPAKSLVARQLTALFALLAGELGGKPGIVPLTDEVPLRTLGIDGLEVLETLPFEGKLGLDGLLEQNLVPLKKQAVRIVISDFLFPHDPARLVRRLASEASALWVIQVLNRWESNPSALGGRRLTDVETGAETDLIVNQRAIDEYLRRLGNLQDELLRNCRRAHATFVTLVADRGLPVLCREELMNAGILRAE